MKNAEVEVDRTPEFKRCYVGVVYATYVHYVLIIYKVCSKHSAQPLDGCFHGVFTPDAALQAFVAVEMVTSDHSTLLAS